MKTCITSVCLCLVFTQSLAQTGPKAMTEDQRLGAFFREQLDIEFKHRPLEATRLGDHRFDHLLEDLSPEARKANRTRWQKTLEEMPKRIDVKKLSRSAQIDFEIWRHQLERDVWLAENTRVYEEDPRVYNDYITESVYLLLTQSTAPKADNIRNVRERIKQVPRIVAAARESLKSPPKVIVETAIKQNRGAIAFYEKGVFDLAEETPALSLFREEAKAAVAALKDYQTFLEKDLLPRASGEWRLGKERFARKLLFELDAGITADEVLKEAEAEAVRVENEMYVIARQLWAERMPGVPLPPDDDKGRRKTILTVLDHVSREHGDVANLVKDARVTAEGIKKFISERDILRVPEPDRCQIIEMPEFQRGNSIAYLNPAPPLDPRSSSFYAISPPPREWTPKRVKSYMEEYNKHILQILTIHEAYPGHYVQLEYSNRHPSVIRKVLSSGVFAEGWAVYIEQVMLDEGYGKGDLALRLSQLKWYLRSVCNAILDYRMHCLGMTDEEALQFLMMRAFQSEAEAILKIIRAKQSSCQLSTYFVGRMAFQRVRRRLQNELVEEFNLGRFHEACLDHGTLPVKYLPEVVPERLKRPR